MTIYYVGPDGDDGNSGETWVLRKETLGGAEALSLVAGDIVYVGPGTYREKLTATHAGASGNPIKYIGDTTGEHTDGIGGKVHITTFDSFDSSPPRLPPVIENDSVSIGAGLIKKWIKEISKYEN